MKMLLKNIVLPLADFTVEADVEIESQVTAVFGPSGAGKTSLLDLVAGLRRARSAFIQLDERVLTDTARGVETPTRRREIGYVPQDLALFPHLSVRGNLLYGCKKDPNPSGLFSFEHVIQTLEIGSLVERGVANLSGGEKQRASLARALLSSPRLLLLDEPLSSLDSKLKQQIIPYLKKIRDEFRLPILYVTHDAGEASALCDEVLVMERGRFVRRGKPAELFGSSEL